MPYPQCTAESVQADLRDTLRFIYRFYLEDAHPIHRARLQVIDQMVIANTTKPDHAAYWANALDRAERAADAGLQARAR